MRKLVSFAMLLSLQLMAVKTHKCGSTTTIKHHRQRKGSYCCQGDVDKSAVPLWALPLPLPAIILISVGLYMLFLACVVWCHNCLKARCNFQCSDCCPSVSPFEHCLNCAQSCDYHLPSLRTCLDYSCPSPKCPMWDCACTCQPPECDSINCVCFEIKFK